MLSDEITYTNVSNLIVGLFHICILEDILLTSYFNQPHNTLICRARKKLRTRILLKTMKMVLNFYHVQNRVLLFLSGVLIILILQCIISQLDRTSESQAGGKRVVLEMKTDKN